MTEFSPMRELPKNHDFGPEDTLVIFGELFNRGYANGIVEEAQKAGMKVIYSTVGRRDGDGDLRPLTSEELEEKQQPIINVPLEAGFDLEPSDKGLTPVDQLKGVKLSGWKEAIIDMEQLEQSRTRGVNRFRNSVKEYLSALSKELPDSGNIVFVHTMAGGFPRAKVVMPATNRVFKGFGDRFASSKEFWDSSIGRLCDISFNEVTGETLYHLLDLTTDLREKLNEQGRKVSYVAYGYHGTDVLVGSEFQWQTYAPYLQGFAKIRLEEIAKEFYQKGVSVSVFNAPEILTNSSSIFLGVEVSLYPLLGAFKKLAPDHSVTKELEKKFEQLMLPNTKVDDILIYSNEYMNSEPIKKISDFKDWPQHNFSEQMEKMRTSSAHLIGLHKDEKDLLTSVLSEVVFSACGQIMLKEAYHVQKPVWWLGHDIIVKAATS